jgi:hypothetical protein
MLWGLNIAALGDVVTEWNLAALEAIRAQNTPPTAASRHLAILHAALFDAVNGIRRTHMPFRITGKVPGSASVESAAVAAGRAVLVSFYPMLQPSLDELQSRLLAGIPDGPQKVGGFRWGKAVAAAILQWRSSDGSNQIVNYTPGSQPGQWRPTLSFGGIVRPALVPHWGQVTPFAVAGGSQFRPPPPPALGSTSYAEEVNRVKAVGAADSTLRTAEQTEIARFWGYGPGSATPPGHWNEIAQAVVRDRGTTLEENARLFALLNIALADAAIVCWEGKYFYNFWRPITAIQEADSDGNPLTEADPVWMPLLPTPPFPEYTSGHSTFSGAAATVLAYFFGSDRIAFTLGSDDLPGVQRSYASFSEAALESGLSRIYGGIHFPSANLHGLSCGAAIGTHVSWHLLGPKPNQSRQQSDLP